VKESQREGERRERKGERRERKGERARGRERGERAREMIIWSLSCLLSFLFPFFNFLGFLIYTPQIFHISKFTPKSPYFLNLPSKIIIFSQLSLINKLVLNMWYIKIDGYNFFRIPWIFWAFYVAFRAYRSRPIRDAATDASQYPSSRRPRPRL